MHTSKLIILTVLLLLMGCIGKSEEVQVLSASPDEYELYLYTNPEQEEKAENYMSALLNWKLDIEDKKRLQFKQTTTESHKVKDIEDDSLPMLVVKKEGRTITKLSGVNTESRISSTLEQSLVLSGT
ncbi:hypothetical protein GLW04_03990 [Halobacillus litoralis]|uniref:Small peptidoglycan-associated lipoprotein n=1 Tax=Halobacillus litoralis TaxID=45668 RepID=A0A845DNP2_9BACI|nr:hypothetical protein [Halobacillus litoralis]MYL19036.1 hypothetical protein [Halobacillus litoralis]MYL37885.1 hypothetical protein [Halobacillus litoralis]